MVCKFVFHVRYQDDEQIFLSFIINHLYKKNMRLIQEIHSFIYIHWDYTKEFQTYLFFFSPGKPRRIKKKCPPPPPFLSYTLVSCFSFVFLYTGLLWRSRKVFPNEMHPAKSAIVSGRSGGKRLSTFPGGQCVCPLYPAERDFFFFFLGRVSSLGNGGRVVIPIAIAFLWMVFLIRPAG